MHCCQVTSVVFSDSCSDSTCPDHLLCPLLKSLFAKSQDQTERASSLENRPPLHPSTTTPLWTLTLKALIRTASGKERSRNTETDVPSMKDHRSCDNCIYYAMIDEECTVMLFVLITIMLGFSFIQYTNTWLSHQAFFINTRDIDI